jgi:hypothetical protein
MSGAKKMPRVAPLLNVRRGAEAIEFYKSAFGAAETFRTESPDGEVVAQLNIGDCDFCSPTSRQSTRTSARKLFAGVRCGWFWLLMIPTASSTKPSRQAQKNCGRLPTRIMAGALAASSIRLGTIGRSANRSNIAVGHGDRGR